jgi:hypothetical protein
MENYTYGEMIYLFLDSELDDALQDNLFMELSRDKSLRGDLLNAYKSKSMFMGEYAAAEMSPALSAAIFSGVSTEKTSGEAMNKAASRLFNIANFGKYFSYVATLIIGLSAGWIMNNNISHLENENGDNKNIVTGKLEKCKSSSGCTNEEIQTTSKIKSVNSQHSNIPIVVSEEDNPISAIANSYKIKIVGDDDNRLGNPLTLTVENQNSPNDILNSVIKKNANIGAIIAPRFDDKMNLNTEKSIFENFGLTIDGIRTLRHYPYREEIYDGQDFNDLALGLYYKFGDNFSAGIELGKEKFPIYVRDNAGKMDYNSSLFWIGATAKYRFDALLFNISPSIKMFGGYCQSGLILRAEPGLSWRVSDNARLNIGLAYSNLFYQYENKLKNAGKLGVKYGVEIDL